MSVVNRYLCRSHCELGNSRQFRDLRRWNVIFRPKIADLTSELTCVRRRVKTLDTPDPRFSPKQGRPEGFFADADGRNNA